MGNTLASRSHGPLLCWGEVLWDVFPEETRLGGAPSNVSYHLARLGAQVELVSRVGDDALGARAIEELADHGVGTALIQRDPSRPTGQVHVEICDGEPTYSLNNGGAWECIALTDAASARLAAAAAICFGTLSQRQPQGRQSLFSALDHTSADCLRVLDTNLRPTAVDPSLIEESLRRASVLKINEHEAALLERTFGVDDAVDWLLREFELGVVAVTCGSKGSRLHSRHGEAQHAGFPATPGGDNVGAGDAFTAVLTLGLLDKWPLERIVSAANRFAAFVASHPGATPKIPDSLIVDVREQGT